MVLGLKTPCRQTRQWFRVEGKHVARNSYLMPSVTTKQLVSLVSQPETVGAQRVSAWTEREVGRWRFQTIQTLGQEKRVWRAGFRSVARSQSGICIPLLQCHKCIWNVAGSGQGRRVLFHPSPSNPSDVYNLVSGARGEREESRMRCVCALRPPKASISSTSLSEPGEREWHQRYVSALRTFPVPQGVEDPPSRGSVRKFVSVANLQK